MPKKHTISATIVVYNEEKRIEKCLKALTGVVDEIIIVHDGPCLDKTLEIAKRYTENIFLRERWGEAEPHRPFTLTQAKGDWILAIDADEIITPKLKEEIRKLVEDADKEDINGYAFYWPFYEKGVRVTKGPLAQAYKLVLFRKSATTCSGVPHDWYKVTGKTKKIPLELDHQQEWDNWSFRVFFKKNAPRTKVDARYRVEKGYAPRFALWYLFKAPVWFMLYFVYSYLVCKLFIHGRLGLRLAIQYGMYNFLLNFYIFLKKIRKTRTL